MFCPACGSTAQTEQKFCRACGLNLQPIIPHVTEHLQSATPASPFPRLLKKIEYLGIAIGASGIALIAGMAIFALLALAFIGPEAKSMSPMWNKLFGVGLLLGLKGAFLFIVPWLLKEFFAFKWSRPSS